MLIFWENSPKRKNLSPSNFTALESLLGKRELRQHLKTSGVNIISIPNKEIEGILAYHNATANMVLFRTGSTDD